MTLLEAALSYARRGWPVFPCAPRAKTPLTPHGLKDATTDPDIIRAWFARWPQANIAIVTGDESGFFVLDVDPRAGGDETLRDLEQQFGPLPETVESLTGGGGRHILFRCPLGLRCAKLGEGLDLKANGGYIIAPPSIHPSGRAYGWDAAHHPEDVELAPAPAWLLNLIGQATRSGPAPAVGERIPEGQRNATLTSLAGSLRRKGLSPAAIEAALLAENRQRCEPPLDEGEVRRIAGSVGRYAPAEDSSDLQRDYGHAAVLAGLFKDRYRWSPERGRWLSWTGQVWRTVPEESVAKAAADELRQHYAARLATATDKTAIQDLSKKAAETCLYARIMGALSFLKGWEGILTTQDQWDADRWALNVQNGTLDLRTFKLRPHDPSDLCTKLAPVTFDPNAPGDKWKSHIERFLPSPNVRRQVQRDLGQALPGVVLEESLPIWHGTGANGKTTTTRALLEVLGDYADRAAPNLLVQGKYERHPTELAELCGLRLAVSAEVDQGKHLAEALVKELTGGDRKRARFMRQDFFSFEQTFSLVLIVNHKPVITGTDDGIWRRVRLIPWEYRIPDAERRPQEVVVNELVSAGSAVLNWLLDGLRDWQADPHWVAPEVRAASDAYRAEMDVLGEFLTDHCVLGPRFTVRKGELYQSYSQWCEAAGEQPLSKKEFGRRLTGRGIVGRRGAHNVHFYVGIGLKEKPEAPNEVTYGDQFPISPLRETNFGGYTENRSPLVTCPAEEILSVPEVGIGLRTNADGVSVSPLRQENPGDYTEKVSAHWRVPEIGDLVYLLSSDGSIQNKEPWAICGIVDAVDAPDGQSYAMFSQTTTGWPLRQCALACDVLEPG